MAAHNLNEFYFLNREEIVVLVGYEMKTLDTRIRCLRNKLQNLAKQLLIHTICETVQTSVGN